ncbi:MAG: VOC family protein [Patescibacteria group bacterium]|nr:VOC family protein [Patescibacteria group bacterium]
MSRVVHFEIVAKDPDKTVEFYKKTFSWDVKKWESGKDYWLLMTGDKNAPGIDGGLMEESDMFNRDSINSYVCTLGVEDINEAISKVESNGGHVYVPVTEIPNVGLLVYCKDPDGNIFGMMESKMA